MFLHSPDPSSLFFLVKYSDLFASIFYCSFFNELIARLFSLAALRAQFIIECLNDLKRNLVKRGLDLLVQHGKPEEIIPLLAKAYNAHTVKKLFLSFFFLNMDVSYTTFC